MGWVANEPGNGNKDRFPVETMVNAMHAHVTDLGEACAAYNGQSRRCCDGIKICFKYLEDAFNLVRIQAIGNQNMHIACRSLKADLSATDSCVETWAGKCHWSVDKNDVLQPFQQALTDVNALRADFCDNLPPERTTVAIVTTRTSSTPSTTVTHTVTPATSVSTAVLSKASTIKSDTTSKTYTSPNNPPTTFNPPVTLSTQPQEESTESSEGTTNDPTSQHPFISTSTRTPVVNGSDVGALGNKTSFSDSGDTAAIVGSVAGGILLIIVGIVFMYLRKRQKNDEPGSSNDSRSVTAFLWKKFQTSKGQRPGTNETEIYAEIDDAFMEAVYGIDRVQKKQPKMRERVFSQSQVNMCYENSTDTGIILSKPPPLPLANSESAPTKNRHVGFSGNKRSPSSASPRCHKHGQIFFGSSYDSDSKKDANLSPSRINSSNHSSPSHKSGNGVSPSHISARPARLDHIRKEDDMVTSFQANYINQSDSQPVDERSTTRGFVMSRPSFTSVRDEPLSSNKSDTGEYTSIVDHTVPSVEEPIYAEPENEYDSANYGHIAPAVVIKEMKRAKSNDYASLRQFVLPKRYSAAYDPPGSDCNSENDDSSHGAGPHYDVPEYVKASDIKKKKGDKKRDKNKKDENPVYENVDTMMVY